jgi:hypothetical protein
MPFRTRRSNGCPETLAKSVGVCRLRRDEDRIGGQQDPRRALNEVLKNPNVARCGDRATPKLTIQIE